jgi:hypothetical protein
MGAEVHIQNRLIDPPPDYQCCACS